MSLFKEQLARLRIERDILDQKIQDIETIISGSTYEKKTKSIRVSSESNTTIRPSINELLDNFMRDKIVVDTMSKITKTEMRGEFNMWFIPLYGHKQIPKNNDIYEYFDQKLGKYDTTIRSNNIVGWTGYRIQYDVCNYDM